MDSSVDSRETDMRSMTNLLEETIAKMTEHGKTPGDVRWVGSEDGTYAMGWVGFSKIADVEYDNGYGSPDVPTDLVVVGDDWWLERYEYDGAECWLFKRKPSRKEIPALFGRVTGGTWSTIDELVKACG